MFIIKKKNFFYKQMGFSKTQSEAAIKSHLTVQAALESIFVYTKKDCNISLYGLWSYLIC